MKRTMHAAAATGLALLAACGPKAPATVELPAAVGVEVTADPAAYWNGATIYFLLTDRFHNGDPSNDTALGRDPDGPVLRTFQGGDLAGVLEKLEEGWFEALGVDAIWMTPFHEQNRYPTDEGTGATYGYHGYWIQDWTAVDPALGTAEDLRAVVDAAHARGIRVLMDAIINHTGPVTEGDPVWPAAWVRTSPRCTFRDYTTTVDCTLVANLPDILTSSDKPVELPRRLLEKWQREGRLVQEVAELDEFFTRTGYPRAPRYYLIKWLTDWVRELGFDGYRVDTAKHFEEWVSAELAAEAAQAFEEWRAANPGKAIDGLPFFVMGEVYNYSMTSGRPFDFGGGDVVDFFDYRYDALINFDFKHRTDETLDGLFTRYDSALREGDLRGLSIVNYQSSHDDGSPWDPRRENPRLAATRLLLAPGGAQIYYGDELARPLEVEGARGDANLRSNMNWSDLEDGPETAALLEHWRKLGRFRQDHPAVGAGEHQRLRVDPYVFSRTLEVGGAVDQVLVALDLEPGPKTVFVYGLFEEGAELIDAYSGVRTTVTGGEVTVDSEYDMVLLERG